MRMILRIGMAAVLSLTLLAVAYRHFSDVRLAQAQHWAAAAYTACEDNRPSSDCGRAASDQFEVSTKHRRLDAFVLAGGVVAISWFVLLCWMVLGRKKFATRRALERPAYRPSSRP